MKEQWEVNMNLTKWKTGRTETGYGEEGLLLLDGENDSIISIRKMPDGLIEFREECDGYYCQRR